MSLNHWLVKAATSIEKAQPLPATFKLEGDIVAKWNAVARSSGIDPAKLADAAAAYFGIRRADMARLESDFAKQVPESIARTNLVLPVVVEGQHALVATADPADTATLDELAFSLGMQIEACVATPGEIESALANVFGEDGGTLKDWGSVPSSLLAAELVLRRIDGAAINTGTSATSKLFAEILRRAYHLNASDAHIQPYGDGAVVRNRIDGVLYRAVNLPATVHQHLIRHVKAAAGMDPTKHMIPQDGELRMELEHKEIDLRLSVIPVGSSERLVIRLLPQNQVRGLSMLRLDPVEQEKLENLSQLADGMILMTGPTGSGKTSLLYAMLAQKNTPDINIMTVEEPVEYRLRGASQIDVDPRTGLTFARALRSILRQDPDVVMIGEIRDEETAGIAAQAAMTGHFVLSTVHTLDALLATVRMRDLGVSSATLADALHAVASQRLVRALCPACKQPLEAHELSANEKRFADLWSTPAWKPTGCDACRETGYTGRVPVVEIVEIKDDLKKELRNGSNDVERLELLALEGGTRFLAEGFAARIEEGATTVDEVLRAYGNGLYNRLQHAANLRRALS